MPGEKKRILIAPLDWGLGHATRCIPIIRACLNRGHEVIIASSGRSLMLLQKEFPALVAVEVPSYNIYYQKKGSFVIKIAAQLGKVFRGIRNEHRITADLVKQYHIDLIIADNRYGIRHKDVKSVIITHQMMVKVPVFSIAEPFVYAWLQLQHKKFDRVWIPDEQGVPNISGDLSHKYKVPPHARYIGILTRFRKPDFIPPTVYDMLAIISGPEPQRTIFEKQLIQQATALGKNCVIVSGRSEINTDTMIAPNIRMISHLPAENLFQLILQSEIIISRGGYSTLMDLALLNKKCIFVPTPGQTEQEYLVADLNKKNMVVGRSQSEFQLAEAIIALEKINGFFINSDPAAFEKELDNVLM